MAINQPGTTTDKESKEDDLIFENFDIDDANYREEYDYDVLATIQELYNKLPNGWIKNNDKKNPGEAPFIHPESGKTSWKHPNRAEIVKVAAEAQKKKKKKEKKKATPNNHKSNPMIQRLKKMVKSGIPLGAVEQRARLEGITDMSIFLEDDNNNDDASATLDTTMTTSPEERKEQEDYSFQKYRLMVKNGIPVGAVQQKAKIDGVQLPDGFFGDTPTTVVVAKKKTKKTVLFHVKAKNKSVEFMTFPDGTPEALLAKLVRRMAQTVQKLPGGSIQHLGIHNNQNLLVDTTVLYNALGGFMGVENQLKQFNKTFDSSSSSSTSNNKGEVKHRRKPFLELARNLGMSATTGPTNIPGLTDLISTIKDLHKDQLQVIQSNIDVGMYDFDSLVQIYRPGTKVVAKNAVAGGVDMICQVEWNRYEQGRTLFGVSKYFKVCFVFCVAVGDHFTLAEVVEGMESFDGKRRLKDLQFVPLTAYGSEGEISSKMLDLKRRGEMFQKVATSGAKYMAYTKGSFFSKNTGSSSGQTSNSAAAFATGGRVMVDIQGAYEYGHTLGVGYDPMILSIKYKYKEYMLHIRSTKQHRKNNNEDQSSASSSAVIRDDHDILLFDRVPEDYLEMTWPAVVGFSFTSKAWGDVLVDGLHDINFQEEAFDRLVLPASRKRMVRAVVRHSSDSFHDVISGKGEGSVFLLHGPPGVGKTLTAEAVSELLHRPLYSVSLGQLGMTPADLETKLGEILELCGKWNALILLDEADIFLEKRSATGSLERNAMVSVMLRLVEYFKGVLFLTSNRVNSLDPAFKTRITLALRYDELDVEAREQVWKNLLLSSGHDLDEFRTNQLAQNILNGREIKNAIRLAMALAAEDNAPLSQDYILETVDILNESNVTMNSNESY